MRISVLTFFLMTTGLYADDFALKPVSVRSIAGQLFVSTTGTPPPVTDIENRDHWVITAKSPAKGAAAISVELLGTPQWSPASSTVTLNYTPPAGLGGANPRTWTWKVTYTGPGGI